MNGRTTIERYWHDVASNESEKMMSGPFPNYFFVNLGSTSRLLLSFFQKKILRHRANNSGLSSFSTVIKYLGDTKQQIMYIQCLCRIVSFFFNFKVKS